MKKIQIITYNPKNFSCLEQGIDINNFNNLKSLDNYEINVFDLNNDHIWINRSKIEGAPTGDLVLSNDLISIEKMIFNRRETKILVCLPQNLNYTYEYYDKKYFCELKNIINIMKSVLKQITNVDINDLYYENTYTEINGMNIQGAFVFPDYEDSITKSKDSRKNTTINKYDIIFTALNLFEEKNTDVLVEFLKHIGVIDKPIEYPKWLQEYKFNDDQQLQDTIENAEAEIKKLNQKISESKNKLDENMMYKSILVTNSDELTKVIYEILEYIFEINLSTFVDEKKEDFLFDKEDICYIGEIKGVTSNIKSEHISQLDVHYYALQDRLEEDEIQKKIKKILIMNYERNREISNRNEVHKTQIELASRNNTLIIDTLNLLQLYEKLLKGNISKQEAIDYINSKIGLFNVLEIEKN